MILHKLQIISSFTKFKLYYMRLCHAAWIRKCPPDTFGFFLPYMILQYCEECKSRERGAMSMYALNRVKRREKHGQPLALETPQLKT